jgi:hypothetical protein
MSQSRALKAASVRMCPKYCSASLAHLLCIEALPGTSDTTFTLVFCLEVAFGDVAGKGTPPNVNLVQTSPNDQSGAFTERRLGNATGDALKQDAGLTRQLLGSPISLPISLPLLPICMDRYTMCTIGCRHCGHCRHRATSPCYFFCKDHAICSPEFFE